MKYEGFKIRLILPRYNVNVFYFLIHIMFVLLQKNKRRKLLEGGELEAGDDSSQTSDSRVTVVDPKTGEVVNFFIIHLSRVVMMLHNYFHIFQTDTQR